MTEADVLALINTFIVANANNEITADVLRPILVAMLEQPNDKTGELVDLDTTDKSNIVNAINEILNTASTTFEIHSGANNPNTTPPASYSIGDWYIRSGSSIYQFNGDSWILLSSSSTISDTESFLATEGQTVFTLSSAPVNVDVWVNDVYQQLTYAYTFSGVTVTLNNPVSLNDRVVVRKYEQNISGASSGSWGGITGDITDQTDLITIINSINASQPVENEYANVAAMLADQGNQTTTFFQYVIDADAYYEKLAASTANINDYRLLSDTETETILDSNSYRVFKIQDIQDEGTPLTSVAGGKISFEYSGANVTAILFDKIYTDAIAKFYGTDVNIRFYNRTTKVYETENIASGAWTTVNTHYYRAAVTGTNIQIADLSVNDKVEFFILNSSTGGGSGDMSAATYDPANKAEQVLTISDIIDEDDMSSDSATKVPTQQSVKAYVDSVGKTEFLTFACSDEDTGLIVSDAVLTFRMPYAMTLTSVRASVKTAPTGANIIVDINESGATILSTLLSIDATEKTSTTATTPVVISDASLADDAEITIDITQIGSTIAGTGLKLTFIGTRT